MGGDLNLKKSWHPQLRKNQERVWKEETAALEERKQIEKLRKEREEERDLENLRKLQESAGGKIAQKRVDWMYSGPSGDGAGVTEEREGYLLGKRRIDHLLQNNEVKASLSKGAAASIDTVGEGTNNVGTARDIQSKISQDPLLAIQKQKMEMQLKMMKEAQKRAKSDERRTKEKERKHKHRHSRRDRSRSRDSEDERERRHRHRHRSRSRSPRRHRSDRDEYRRRERSISRDSADDRDRRHRHERRSRSPRRGDRYDRDDRKHQSRRSDSRSPRRHDRDDRDTRNNRDSFRRCSPTPYRRPPRHERPEYRPRPQRPVEEPAQSGESAADKLAKMQAEAEALEIQRKERVRAQEAKDAEEEEKHRKKLDGGQRFASGMRMKATEDLDLGDVMARGRAGFAKGIDA